MLLLQEDLVPTCRELGIAFLAYSPLGRGMLTGTFSIDSLSPTDFRRHASPRHSKEAMLQVTDFDTIESTYPTAASSS